MNAVINRIKKLRPATLVAMLALFVAIGGSATAASGLINGKQIKNKSIAGKKLKNKTITKNKLAPATVKSLKGQNGAQGPKGAKGDPGADGVVSPVYKEFSSVNIPVDGSMAIGTVDLPAGKYMVTGTVKVFAVGTGRFECALQANNGGGNTPISNWNSPAANQRNTLPLTFVTTTDNVTAITLGCSIDGTNGSASGSLTLVPVQ